MAEAFLKSFDPKLEVVSAGTDPTSAVHPKAIIAMAELGIDLSNGHPKSVDEFLSEPFDYVITVCGGAREACPTFQGDVRHNIHIGFDDPAEATGTEEEIMDEFRRIRDEIKSDLSAFLKEANNK